ncbi:hypothetical protein [Pelagicoccus sp. SDUM812003]|uniref:hypothetical protein n=1 Tax=Pelagicoccus sp. SDUM812003 TaxID=3041267 RepID=UPI00280E0E4C|nr:hypothetical protein [Pelagicoccus sp. SDUM812003]MDQ8201998.1 hypothetical protein [Pelagicoccus sp. SDUM812003]
MLISLLFLIILAVMAFQSRKILLPALLFGSLKAVASCFYTMAESELTDAGVVVLASSQFTINTLLGLGIAYLVVKHSQDWKYMFATTALAVVTFLTSMFETIVVTQL